ncbi:MAG: hypothetical protein R3B39_01660 [Candidatus Paceibacterota bacterium]
MIDEETEVVAVVEEVVEGRRLIFIIRKFRGSSNGEVLWSFNMLPSYNLQCRIRKFRW